MCGVAAMTVIRWIDSGALPAVRTPGGWRRVRRADAERQAAVVAGRTSAPVLTAVELASLLAEGNREAVVAWARASAGTGKSVGDLVRTHLSPAMRHIGDQWGCGEVSVGQEHRATGIAYDALALLRDLIPPPAPAPDRPRLLLVCAEGEQHALPARMAAERFIDAGWQVDMLGADMPAGEVVRQLRETDPDALGVSVTTAPRGARAVLRAVAAAGWNGPILAGGAAAASVARGRPEIRVDDGSDSYIERVAADLAAPRGT